MVTIRNTIDSFGYGATGWIDVEADGLIAGKPAPTGFRASRSSNLGSIALQRSECPCAIATTTLRLPVNGERA